MANQMIALQARNPQLPDPARATTQMANLMNMASQQRAAQLQGERIRQEMDYARAGEERAVETQRLNVRKEDQAYRVAGMTELRNRGVGVLQSGSEEAYQLWLRQADAIDPDSAAVMRQIAPTFNKDAMTFAITKADEFIANNTSKRKSEIIYDKNGFPIEVQTGGNTAYEATPIVVTKIRDVNQPPRATPTAPQPAPAGPVPVGEYGETRVVNPESIPLTPYQQEHLREMQSGLGMSQPASFTRGAGAAQITPDVMSNIVNSAFETGVMAQVDFDQLLASQPPQNKQALVDSFRRANITLQANAPSLADSAMGQQQPMAANPVQTPQARFADLGSQPMMRQTQAQYRVGDPIQGRNPSIPPSANVAPQILGSQKAAETAGSENIKVGTQPRIVAGEERAKRLEKLRGEMPIAQAETQTLVNSLTGRINAIDEYLRSGSRNSIIGTIEGRIPRAFQSETRADAQALYDYITSNAVLQKLIDDRGQTETGGSPQGVVSDADLKVAAQASNKLTQTGSERKQEIEMQRLRDELYRTREQAIQKYNNVYREVMKEAPELRLKVRTVAPKYKSAPQTPTRAKSLQNIFGG